MSDINFEQRCAIRFCFRLGHSATKTLAKLQQAYEDIFCQEPRFFGALRHFQKEESRLKMNQETEDLHIQETMKMSTESGSCAFRPLHSGLKRPKNWPKVEKDSDMIEIL